MSIEQGITELEKWLIANARFIACLENLVSVHTWQCILVDKKGTGENYVGFGNTLSAAINNAIDAHARHACVEHSRSGSYSNR